MGKTQILVVDDDPFVREVLADILTSKDYEVDTANNGEEGFQKYSANPAFQLVISDLDMPVANGLQLIKRLRIEMASDVPVIVLSGNSEIAVAIEALQTGASEYLLKDENMSDTISLTVEKVLERKRVLDQNRQLMIDVTNKNLELKNIVDTMTEVGMSITSQKNFASLLDAIIYHGRSLTRADAGTLYLLENDKLVFKIVQNDTLNIKIGGSSGGEIQFPPLEIKESNVAGYVILKKNSVNIPDVYASDQFDFSGPKEYDKISGYRSRSMFVVPLINRYNEAVGVLQLLNSIDPDTGEVVAFSATNRNIIHSLASQAAVAVTNLQFKEKTEKLLEEVLDVKNYNENILQSLTNGVITLDTDMTLIKCNAAALRILKTTEEQLVNRSAEDCFGKDNQWLIVYIHSVLESGEPSIAPDTELVIEGEDRVPLNLSVVPLNNVKKELIGVMLVMEDITIEKRVKGTLSRYVTEEVAERLLESGEAVLGGQIKEASVLFSDIRGFTTITEKLGAQATVTLLNDYFTIMVEIISEHNGILDKFIGDAILAVFGIPFGTPQDADRSVQTAIGMMNALKIYNQKRQAENLFSLNIGVGINTDEIISGNIGSMKRMDYTCIGDGVNLASRLEGVNKYFGTNILISENTLKKIKGDYLLRRMDLIQVKGKVQPVEIYEVMDFHDEDTFPHLKECREIFQAGISDYRNRDWQKGIGKFNEVLALNSSDKASRVYIERCQQLAATPPDDDWAGVWVMETK